MAGMSRVKKNKRIEITAEAEMTKSVELELGNKQEMEIFSQ
jgi:hypothetical protein